MNGEWDHVSGEVFIENGEFDGSAKAKVAANLPLPNIGAWYWYAPSSKWLLTSRVDWLSASIGDYSGGLWNAAVGVQYQFSNNFGIAAEYAYFELNGDIDKTHWHGSMKSTTFGQHYIFLPKHVKR